MTTKEKETTGLSSLQSLLSQGYSKTTLARVAYLRIPQLKQWEQEMIFPADTALVRINALDALSQELGKLNLPYDPVAFYESHIVLLEKDGLPYGARLSHFFELLKWKVSDILTYAESTDAILSASDIAEEYPASYKVVTASDGNKSIVQVPGIEIISANELSENWKEYTLIK